MSKLNWKGATIMGPLPAVFVGCGTVEHPNLITVAWTGIINSDPAMTYVSIRPGRFSHHLIQESGHFTINLATAQMVRKLDSCGIYTGAKMDKFKKFSLTPQASLHVSAPGVEESPLTLECNVTQCIPLGTHDMFLAKIEGISVDEKLLDAKGKLCLNQANLIAYSHGDYLAMGRKLGHFGYSVKKKNNHKAKTTKERGNK